jgi:hypothetical protein
MFMVRAKMCFTQKVLHLSRLQPYYSRKACQGPKVYLIENISKLRPKFMNVCNKLECLSLASLSRLA